jgi:MtaA/CmuA family methyltransferase
MNSYERMQNQLSGKPVDRIPNFNIYMARGAHHIQEKLSDYYQDYRVLVRANLAMVSDFQVDIVQTISDPYREAADLGMEVEFPEDGLPVRKRPLILQPGDLSRLKPVSPAAGRRMSDRLEAIRSLREQVGGGVPVMGWVEGALAEANDLRGDSALMVDLYDRPEWVLELLEFCVEQEIAFARAQVAAGADLIGLGDSMASQISPRMYERFALPYQQRIFAAVHEMGALARLHICGNTSRILHQMVMTGADIIDIDWMVDIDQAALVFGEQVALCGNFDPVRVMLHGTPEEVEAAVAHCIEHGGPKYFSAAGCEIPDGTPAANLQVQVGVLEWGEDR